MSAMPLHIQLIDRMELVAARHNCMHLVLAYTMQNPLL